MLIPDRLRALRKRRGLTVASLAEQVGIHKGHLSRIERGEKTPSLGTLMALAKVLESEIGELFGERVSEDEIVVRRREDRQRLPGDGHYGIEVLLSSTVARPLGVYIIEPGVDFLPHDIPDHAGLEAILVLQGSIELQVADRLIALAEGDCASFDGRLTHRLRRAHDGRASVVVVVAHDAARG